VPYDIPAVAEYRDFNFSTFNGTFGDDLGFERILKYLGTTPDGFQEYLVPMPLCRKITDKICDWCEGTGEDPGIERRCAFCEGGKDIAYDYKEAYAVSASLSLFLFLMQFPECETHASVQQLFTVKTITRVGPHGASLGGSYSRDLVQYLRSRLEGPVLQMVSAMKIAWGRLDGKIFDFYEHSFEASTQGTSGWLNVSCPGDATGLHPSDHMLDGDYGYDFSCHNVDSPMQQLTLLAALGALNYTARRDFGQR
jgi:hypothetical protein